MPDYRNSTVHALEIGLAFRRHPADKDYFLHGDKSILSYSLQLLAELPNYYNPPPKKIPATQFHSQQFICLQWLYIWIRQRQLTFLDTVPTGLTTDMQTYKSLNLVMHLFHKTL